MTRPSGRAPWWRPTLSPAWERTAFGLALAAQLVVLYWPRGVSAGGLPHVDKAVHVAIFAAVAVTGLRAGLSRVLVLGGLAAHAPLSELLQAVVLPDRGGDPWDVLADLLGVGLGALAAGPARGASWRGERSSSA